ncbi:MAG: SLC26A/SulP transporter family protein [Fibrobacteria bacterium]|nr:SLC26A/SulP transporter family protein [Fibrobacteria bacterium]
MKLFSNFKGDFIGGMTAGILPLPRAMALGAMVFSPLGPEYLPLGVIAGIMTSAIGNLSSVFRSGMPFMNNGPFSLSTFMMLSAFQTILMSLDKTKEGYETIAITLLFFTVLLSGIFLVIIGLLRIGSLAKFIPYPVLSGMINGTAVLIMFSQIKPFLGLSKGTPWSDVFSNPALIQPFTMLVGLIACLAIWGGPKLSKKIPAPIYGIAAGVLAYYLLKYAGLGTSLGPVVGTIPGALPLPRYALPFSKLLLSTEYWPLLGHLATLALGLAGVNALRSLVVTSAGENLAKERYNSNRELVGLGISNITTSFFGGLSVAGSISSTLSNYQYGGRTPVSRFISGLLPLFVLLALYPLVALLPNVVLAGMLIMIGIKAVDKWSLRQFFRIRSSLAQRDFTAIINVSQMVAVVTVLLVFGIFPALGAGVALAISWFVLRMGKSVIRSDLTMGEVRSNTIRQDRENQALDRAEHRIHSLELEGSIFFGTADQIGAYVEDLFKKDVDFIIFEFTRVREIDSTGAKLIIQIMQKYQKQNGEFYLAGLRTEKQFFRHRELLGLLSEKDKKAWVYPDLNIALAVAEDRLLDRMLESNRYSTLLELPQVDALSTLNSGQIENLVPYLELIEYTSGNTVFTKDSPGDSVYFIVRGRARIFLPQPEGDSIRLATLCTGSCFGEMALIDGKERSADIVAVGTLKCYCLSLEALNKINQDHPDIGFSILKGLSKELSNRLRFYNRKISLVK